MARLFTAVIVLEISCQMCGSPKWRFVGNGTRTIDLFWHELWQGLHRRSALWNWHDGAYLHCAGYLVILCNIKIQQLHVFRYYSRCFRYYRRSRCMGIFIYKKHFTRSTADRNNWHEYAFNRCIFFAVKAAKW